MHTGKIIVFGGTRGQPLAEEICKIIRIDVGARKLGHFKDGEVELEITQNVRGHDVFIVNQAWKAEDILETIFLGRTAKMSSAGRVTLVIPYLGYNRQERKDRSRVPISAKIIIEMLKLSTAHRVVLLDLHSAATAAHFEPEMVHDHLYGAKIMIPQLREILTEPYVVASPDVGGVARARKYGQHLKSNALVIFSKDRPAPGEVDEEKIQIIGDVKDKDVVFIDDMTDSGGSLIADAKKAKEAGANRIFACVTHGIFSKGLDVFPKGLITEIITTDSMGLPPASLVSENVKVTVCPVAPLYVDAINRLHQDDSLGDLFLS